jgi:hypothetical protein
MCLDLVANRSSQILEEGMRGRRFRLYGTRIGSAGRWRFGIKEGLLSLLLCSRMIDVHDWTVDGRCVVTSHLLCGKWRVRARHVHMGAGLWLAELHIP